MATDDTESHQCCEAAKASLLQTLMWQQHLVSLEGAHLVCEMSASHHLLSRYYPMIPLL